MGWLVLRDEGRVFQLTKKCVIPPRALRGNEKVRVSHSSHARVSQQRTTYKDTCIAAGVDHSMLQHDGDPSRVDANTGMRLASVCQNCGV